MKIPESWLRRYCNPSIGTEALADALTMAGLEVEDLDSAGPAFSGVVVARILSAEPHPSADRLRVCQVDIGADALSQIVCGAPNAAAGLTVPCAVPGAKLPGGLEIGQAKLRGVESAGMLCSARELGLGDDHGGLWVLDGGLQPGSCLREALGLDEKVLTLKLTPNRADCLSMVGVARELAAITGAPLLLPEMLPVEPTLSDRLPVEVVAKDLCGRFSGRVIRGVNAKAPTPDWMKRRLEQAGQRSISALVDISNYVMLELGRPTHIFDLDRISERIVVRWGAEGETVKLLNGKDLALSARFGVIADAKGPLGLAGIMGGDSSAVTDDTQNIYVEAAFWWPASIRGRTRDLAFSTDAAHRFERGVDFSTTVVHIEYISRLILEICGGQVGPMDDQVFSLPERRPVTMRFARCEKIIGVPIGAENITSIFSRLGFAFESSVDGVTVTPPNFRFDIEREEDLVEEVARLYGYEHIPMNPRRAQASFTVRAEASVTPMMIRQQVAALGYQEVMTFGFVDEAAEEDFSVSKQRLPLRNPIASQYSTMRSQLFSGLLGCLKHNLNRQQTRVRIFECGAVFHVDETQKSGPYTVGGIDQPLMLGGLAYGSHAEEQWGLTKRPVDLFDVKGDIERLLASKPLRFVADVHPALHPGQSARVECEGAQIGWIGTLHPKLAQKYDLPSSPVLFEVLLAPMRICPVPTYQELSKFPVIIRDLALLVSAETPVADVLSAVDLAVVQNKVLPVTDVKLFDQYRGQGVDPKEKSLAIRLTLQDTSKTLSDDDADRIVQTVLACIQERTGARLR